MNREERKKAAEKINAIEHTAHALKELEEKIKKDPCSEGNEIKTKGFTFGISFPKKKEEESSGN